MEIMGKNGGNMEKLEDMRRDSIPVEFIQDEIERFEEIGDNAIPKLQPKYYDRAKYLRELLSTWETFGRQWERKKNVTTPFD